MFVSVEPINFLVPLKNITLNDIGLRAEFECEISKEGMKGSWFKGDKPVKQGDKYTIVDEKTVHRLIIDNALEEDEDKYTVKFREDTTSKAKLTIKGKGMVS